MRPWRVCSHPLWRDTAVDIAVAPAAAAATASGKSIHSHLIRNISPRDTYGPSEYEGGHIRLPEVLGGYTRPISRGTSGEKPFSPQIPHHLGVTTNQTPHHRSPLLLHRQLSRDREKSVSGPSSTPPNYGRDGSPAFSLPLPTSATKLISLSAMSPMSHRRVLSGSGSNPPFVPQPLFPTTHSIGAANQLTHPPLGLRGHSLPASGSPSMPRREIGLPPSGLRGSPPSEASSAAPSPRHQLLPAAAVLPPAASRVISLSSMSPMVSSRSLLSRQAQQQQHPQHAGGTPSVPSPSAHGAIPPTLCCFDVDFDSPHFSLCPLHSALLTLLSQVH